MAVPVESCDCAIFCTVGLLLIANPKHLTSPGPKHIFQYVNLAILKNNYSF